MEGPHAPGTETNGLAIAGFVCSLLGIFGSCGLLSPIGLILSLVAIGREPRGFAIAGVVIGALGTCFMIPVVIVAIALPMLLLSVLIGLGLGGTLTGIFGPEFSAKLEMAQIAGEIQTYQDDHTMLPITLDDLAIADVDLKTDQWGHPYGYELGADGQSYRLFSVGPDGATGTADDIVANPDWVIHHDASDSSSQTSPPPPPPSPPPPTGSPAPETGDSSATSAEPGGT